MEFDMMMHVEKTVETDPHSAEHLADFFGNPAQVDQAIRQALQFCWMALPRDRKTPEELEKQLRRMVERALRDFREDREAFGVSSLKEVNLSRGFSCVFLLIRPRRVRTFSAEAEGFFF